MTMQDPVFNEPSATPIARDANEARTRIDRVLDVLTIAPTHGLGKGLRTSEAFYSIQIADQYTFLNWLDDPAIGRDQRELFLSLGAGRQFIRPSDVVSSESMEECEISCHGIIHKSFLAAYRLESVLVSFDNDAWSQPELTATLTSIEADAELLTESIVLVNFARPEHFAYHAQWFSQRNAITGISDLWSRRAEIFPNLTFCPSVEGQLQSCGPIFDTIVARLMDLQNVAAKNQPFNKDAFRTRCNATSTETFSRFGADYDFRDPAGALKRCGWHLYLPNTGRIYFAPDIFRYVIGHIGEHLPTVKFQ